MVAVPTLTAMAIRPAMTAAVATITIGALAAMRVASEAHRSAESLPLSVTASSPPPAASVPIAAHGLTNRELRNRPRRWRGAFGARQGCANQLPAEERGFDPGFRLDV